MEILVEGMNLDEYFKDDSTREKHRKNKELLKLAVANIDLARKLNLKKGLTYDCTDGSVFNVRLPTGERILSRSCSYEHPESKFTVSAHYVFLRNGWLEPVDIGKVVDEISTAYPPLTSNLKCHFIRNSLKSPAYSRKLFECSDSGNKIRPIYLPVKIVF
jgi:hypothetical protein